MLRINRSIQGKTDIASLYSLDFIVSLFIGLCTIFLSLQQNIVWYFIHDSSYSVQKMQEIKVVGWGGGGLVHCKVECHDITRL